VSLFDEPLTVMLTPSEVEVFTRPIVGDGGHQRLLKTLVPRLTEKGLIRCEDSELLHAARYAFDYKSGGYQDRFKVLIAAARRTGWSRG